MSKKASKKNHRLSERDLLAAAALPLVTKQWEDFRSRGEADGLVGFDMVEPYCIVGRAYRIADAMLKVREAKP